MQQPMRAQRKMRSIEPMDIAGKNKAMCIFVGKLLLSKECAHDNQIKLKNALEKQN